MLHTTLVLSIVPSFWLLNRDFPPNNPSALSIFNYRSGSQTFSVIPHFEQGGPIQAPPVPHRSHKMVGQAPYFRAILPEGTQVQVWPDVISQWSPHLFSASLPVITSCPIQIKALKHFKVALIALKYFIALIAAALIA